MKNAIIKSRNSTIAYLYKHLLKPVFFAFDPEMVHDFMSFQGRVLGTNPLGRGITKLLFGYSHPALEQDILGIHFKNPLGLSAGFDKNARLLNIIPYVGFGFEEIGSITGEPCEGNPKPRLWRHKDLKSIRVNYGLMNDGAEAIAKGLKNKKFKFPVGISVAKTNNEATCDTEVGIEDYAKAFSAFTKIGDYFTVNLSCPNTFGGQPFTDSKRLDQLLDRLDKIPTKKPIFLKLSPDLSEKELDALIAVAQKHRVHGFVCTNLTKNHKFGKGGLSGGAVKELSNKQISYVYKKTKGKFLIIGCGGIFSAEDAYAKLKAGASLLQLITGLIYEGPGVISEINRRLVELMQKDGYKNISEIKRA